MEGSGDEFVRLCSSGAAYFVTVRHVERPAAGAPVGALVFFHGYGGTPEEWLEFLDELDPERRLHGYLPEAPYLDSGGGRTWFRRGSTEPHEAQLAPIVEWLDGLPYPPETTVLGGWSQGTNLAYALALAPGRRRPAGVVALGGGFRNELPPDLAPPLPRIAIAHGRGDDAVPVDVARQARAVLESAGATVLYCETDVGHRLDQAVIPELRAFVANLP